jgi:hypothetical protein
MHITPDDLRAATADSLISRAQAEGLWAFWTERGRDRPRFAMTHVLYYLGGAIAIGALTLFVNLGWQMYGGWGLCFIGACYALLGVALTEYFLHRRLPIPGGICAALAVAVTPLAVYGFQVAQGWWPEQGFQNYRDYHVWIDWRWIFMECATLAAGVTLFWRYRLPFLLMPVSVTLWYMSMDLAMYLLADIKDASLQWEFRKWFSMWFGASMTLIAFWVDVRQRGDRDQAFWLYLFGVMAFWSGLSFLHSDSELTKFYYGCTNVAMVLAGVVLKRRVFTVFGAAGLAIYLGHLAHDVFRDSLLFPFVLTAIGFGVIGMGLAWHRREAKPGGARLRLDQTGAVDRIARPAA